MEISICSIHTPNIKWKYSTVKDFSLFLLISQSDPLSMEWPTYGGQGKDRCIFGYI